MQCAAVRTCLVVIMVPPQRPDLPIFKRTCQGYSCLSASPPPTMRLELLASPHSQSAEIEAWKILHQQKKTENKRKPDKCVAIVVLAICWSYVHGSWGLWVVFGSSSVVLGSSSVVLGSLSVVEVASSSPWISRVQRNPLADLLLSAANWKLMVTSLEEASFL